ncbi:MAG: hypothetical protein B6I18_01640 [Bacteroidetes bacterium 4572_112]|nr:MAG: hypothetical protein B6I18_01640 [Bacteroidetes bacterium 4572_112]
MVYPNPNNGSFNIKFAAQKANKIIVWDMLGKLVLEQNVTTNDKVEQHKIIVE